MKKAQNTIKTCDWTVLSSKDMGLLIIRIFVGVIMVWAGMGKLMNPAMGLGFFAKLNLNDGFFWAVAFTETIAGIALVLGYHTRGAAALITGVILGILLLTWWMPGQDHLPYTISLMTNTLALFIMGAGAWSLDSWCKKTGNCTCEECEKVDSCCGCGSCDITTHKKEEKKEIEDKSETTEI